MHPMCPALQEEEYRMRLSRVLGTAALALGMLAGCGGDSDSDGMQAGGEPRTAGEGPGTDGGGGAEDASSMGDVDAATSFDGGPAESSCDASSCAAPQEPDAATTEPGDAATGGDGTVGDAEPLADAEPTAVDAAPDAACPDDTVTSRDGQSCEPSLWLQPASMPETGGAGDVAFVRVGLDDVGQAMLVYRPMGATGELLARWNNGDESWGAPETITAGRSMTIPAALTFNQGSPSVLWQWGNPDNTSWDVRSNTRTGAASWEADQVVVADETVDGRMKLVGADDGYLLAVWEGNATIWASQREPAGAWGAPERVDDGGVLTPAPARPRRFDVGLDAAGNAIVVWTRRRNNVPEVDARHLTRGVGWGPVVPLGNAGEIYEPEPVLAVNAAGDAIAAWDSTYDGSGTGILEPRGIHVARYASQTGAWSPRELVSADEELRLEGEACVGIDADGNAIVAWMEGDPSDRRVIARRWSPSTWSPPEVVNLSNAHAGLALAMAPDGSAFAVWEDDIRWWAARFVPGDGWMAPQDVAGAGLDPQLAYDGDVAVMAWLMNVSGLYRHIYTVRTRP